MEALEAQSIRRLYCRLEALRQHGPVPALMVEHRIGAPEEETQPLPGFENARCWHATLRRLPDHSDVGRNIWVLAAPAAAAALQGVCLSAGRVVVPVLRDLGYHVGLAAPGYQIQWLWSVFEMAELRLPGTDLLLDGGCVLRRSAGMFTIGEPLIEASIGGPAGDLFRALAEGAGETRYWKLNDLVEASLAVLDIVQPSPQPPANAATPRQATDAAGKPRRPARSTKKIDVDRYLGRLESQLRKKLTADFGSSEGAILEAMVRELYSLSAADLVPLLRPLGFRGSSKTVQRSDKYSAWERYRKPASAIGAAADPTRRAPRRQVPSEATARVQDAVESGNLTLRVGGRGATRIGKTSAEKAADEAADRFAKERGIDLPPAR